METTILVESFTHYLSLLAVSGVATRTGFFSLFAPTYSRLSNDNVSRSEAAGVVFTVTATVFSISFQDYLKP